ncbi:MAG: hypothetical protein ACRD2J_07880, partial [Thermoanaerobaculia bacterium]
LRHLDFACAFRIRAAIAFALLERHGILLSSPRASSHAHLARVLRAENEGRTCLIAIKRHAESSLVLHRMAVRLHLMICAMTVAMT